jgi:hypothetical protein
VSSARQTNTGRLAFLDWTRGLAAVVMLQGHAFHAFTKQELRDGGPYVISQFFGGLPPAAFLFLVGVTLAFLMHSSERKGLKVDILNCMGLAVAAMSIMAIFSTADRVRMCAGLGVAIAAASPVVSQLDWSWAPPVVKGYLAPDYFSFGFFPWAAYVAFGMSAGSILRLIDKDQFDRAAQWAALIGFGFVLAGQSMSNFASSVYAKSEFWLDSPWQVAIKVGVILLLLAFAYLWTRHSEGRWSWVRQFGVTSLLVYWVHVELIYGRWLWFWKEGLTAGQTLAAAVALIALMLLLSLARSRWKNWRLLIFSLGWALFADRRARETAD